MTKNIVFKNVKQNSEEWFKLREGKATSSNWSVIMAHGDFKFGKPAEDYAYRIALEIVTGKKDPTNNFKNKYMARGNDFEDRAKLEYEKIMLVEVTNGGFFYNDKLGDSPDGNIGRDGGVEFKVVIAKNQKERIKKGGYDTTYKWQIVGHMLMGDKKYIDFCQYCPEMPKNKRVYIFRVTRESLEEEIKHFKYKFELFWAMVESEIEFLKDDVKYECINI